MERSQAIPYVSFVVDDAGCGRELGADPHAIVREFGKTGKGFKHPSILIGWKNMGFSQTMEGIDPLFVAVHSYLDIKLTKNEAEMWARGYLVELDRFTFTNWTTPDYIIL